MNEIWTRLRAPLFLALVTIQLAALGQMVYARQRLLDTGERVLLRTQPIDPRSLLSGYYVQLNLQIAALNRRDLGLDTAASFAEGSWIYVRLEKEARTKFHRATGLAASAEELRRPGAVIIRGRVESDSGGGVWINYGIDQYFVPQHEAAAIEEAVNRFVAAPAPDARANEDAAPPAHIEAAIDRESGEAALSRLFLNDRAVEFH